MIKVLRLRREAAAFGEYDVPVEQRRYVPFNRPNAEPETIQEIHERIRGCYKAVDYQVWDRNYCRWIRGNDVADLGKKPQKNFPSLSRIYSEKFHNARVAEGLTSQRETVEFLLSEYESLTSPVPYSTVRIEYPVHLKQLSDSVKKGTKTPTVWLQEGFPNRFLVQRGVRNVGTLRQTWGEYATRKLAPLDHAYAADFAELLQERGRALGIDREARDAARAVTPSLVRLCGRGTSLDESMASLFERPDVRERSRLNGTYRATVSQLAGRWS